MPAWKYEIPIMVTNNTFANLTDYQVKITVNTATLISNGKMNTTGDDIRFTDTTNCTSIPYWIESGINTSSTIIWIKLPLLKASSSTVIRMLYGNSAASAASNGDSTFMLFDDFNGSTLNTSKWNVYGTNSNYSISNSVLSLNSGANSNVGTRIFVSTNSLPSPIIVEANIAAITGYYTHLGTLNANTFSGYTMFFADQNQGSNSGMHIGQSYSNNGSFSTSSISTNSNPGTVSGIWQTAWPSSDVFVSNWPGGSFSNSVSGLTLSGNVQVGFGLDWTSIGTVSFDWVRARKYAASEPTIQIGREKLNHNSGIEPVYLGDDIKIYPNPTTNRLFVDFRHEEDILTSVCINDINGKALQIQNVSNRSDHFEIPLKNLPNGIYFVKLNTSKGIYVSKIIIANH